MNRSPANNDAEGKEEARLSCRYLDPKKLSKEVKTGTLVITSDEIKFLENTLNDVGMNCAIFEVGRSVQQLQKRPPRPPPKPPRVSFPSAKEKVPRAQPLHACQQRCSSD
jgi:hypothetical protein